MAIKKYLSLEKLTEYDELIKAKIDEDVASAKSYADGLASGKADSNHNHDTKYDAKGSADTALASAIAYTDTEVAKKANSSHTHAIADVTNLQSTLDGKASSSHNHDSVYAAKSHGHSVASTSSDGFMSSAMFDKLGGIAEGANKTVVDSSLSSSSTNPVQNKVVNSALSGKVPTSRTINGKALTGNISLSASDVGADASGTASSVVSTHNTSATAHSDIRDLITGLTTRLNALADSDDTTLDQLSEIVAYIKTNKDLIDGITTSKVNVSDIVNNLTSTATNKPLAANQGKVLKDLIDALTTVVDGKANSGHSHAISDVTGLQSALDGKAASSHGTHVSYSTTAPVMDGTASVGTASTVARSDHKHPTDTSRASKTEFDTHNSDTTKHITSTERTNWNGAVTKLNGIESGANKTVVDSSLSSSSTNPVQNKVVNTALGNLTSAVSANTSSINSHSTSIGNLQTTVSEIQEITSEEISALFAN